MNICLFNRIALYKVGVLAVVIFTASFSSPAEDGLRLFTENTDIGSPSKAGSCVYEATTNSWLIAGGGANMWFTNDSCHFVSKTMSGDFALSSGIEWPEPGGNAHRKACLMIRQSLDPESAYVDVAIHGDGLTSLQYRETKGGPTREIQVRPSRGTAAASQKSPPIWAAIQRQGEVFFVSLSTPLPFEQSSNSQAINPTIQKSNNPAPAGASLHLRLHDPVHIGLAVCAHDDSVLEKARFFDVSLAPVPVSTNKPVLHCSLEIVPISSKDRRVVYHTTNHIEAPNWSRDGRFLVFNGGGKLFRLPVAGGEPERIDTGSATRCNNDHGFSPDGATLAISDQTSGKSLIYTVPATGGTPKLITATGPSYWHGWSPDGSTLAYCAERNGEFDIYTIPASGGEEKRLTTAQGLDDGPEYSPDGKYIYFNSERSGSMQIWRMKPDGSAQEQITADDFNNWFPHPSPDGKWLAFLSYDKSVTGHPANQPVTTRLMPLAGGPIQELARLFGGQGTINVPSWSPDSRQLAFVSYELIRP